MYTLIIINIVHLLKLHKIEEYYVNKIAYDYDNETLFIYYSSGGHTEYLFINKNDQAHAWLYVKYIILGFIVAIIPNYPLI